MGSLVAVKVGRTLKLARNATKYGRQASKIMDKNARSRLKQRRGKIDGPHKCGFWNERDHLESLKNTLPFIM